MTTQKSHWPATRILAAAAAALVSAHGAIPAQAYGITAANSVEQRVTGGAAAMLRLRVPLGSNETRPAATLALAAGSSWHAVPADAQPGAIFIPTLEAGISFSGDPVVKLGGYQPFDRALGAQTGSWCELNRALCIGGGIALGVLIGVAIIGFALADATDETD